MIERFESGFKTENDLSSPTGESRENAILSRSFLAQFYMEESGLERKPMSEFEANRIAQMLMQRHASYLNEEEYFEVSGHRSKEEVYTTVTLTNQDNSLHYPVECRMDLTVNPVAGPVAAQDVLLDFQDYYFGRYFEEDRDIYLTIDWSAVQFDNYTLQTKGQISNPKVEQLADRLMAGEITPQEARRLARKKEDN